MVVQEHLHLIKCCPTFGFSAFIIIIIIMGSGNAVGMVTVYGQEHRGVKSSSPGRIKNFHFSISSRPALGSSQPPIQWVPGGLSLGVKRLGREADHSPPTGPEVKKM
jgi:hypothetical protein